jgi:hypothetical protein
VTSGNKPGSLLFAMYILSRMKVDVLKKTKISVLGPISKKKNMMGTSYLLAQRTAKGVKPHTTSQKLAFSCAKDHVSVLMENRAANTVDDDNYANNSRLHFILFSDQFSGH